MYYIIVPGCIQFVVVDSLFALSALEHDLCSCEAISSAGEVKKSRRAMKLGALEENMKQSTAECEVPKMVHT